MHPRRVLRVDSGPDSGGFLEGELVLDDPEHLGGSPERPFTEVCLEHAGLARIQGHLEPVGVALGLLAGLDESQLLALAGVDVDHHPHHLGGGA